MKVLSSFSSLTRFFALSLNKIGALGNANKNKFFFVISLICTIFACKNKKNGRNFHF